MYQPDHLRSFENRLCIGHEKVVLSVDSALLRTEHRFCEFSQSWMRGLQTKKRHPRKDVSVMYSVKDPSLRSG